MRTICTNLECLQVYQIKPESLGKLTRCKNCNTVFQIEEFKEGPDPLDLFADEDESETEDANNTEIEASAPVTTKTVKRKTKEIIAEKIREIKLEANKIRPNLKRASDNGANESDTRLLIDDILQYVLGYQKEDIKTEQRINTKKADYVISISCENRIIVEAKAIRNCLAEKHIDQAIHYGALAGIPWVVLTNGWVWQLYRISFDDKLSSTLIFTIDLLDGLDSEEADHFYLISKHGMSKKYLLEKKWQKISALSSENLREALLSEEVVSKIRNALLKQTGYKVTNEEIRCVLMSRELVS